MAKYITIHEFALSCRVSDRTVRRWIKARKLKAKRVKGKTLVKVTARVSIGEKPEKKHGGGSNGGGEVVLLREQLKALNKQVDRLTATIQKQADSLSRQQALTMDLQRRLPLLETKKPSLLDRLFGRKNRELS